MIIFFLLIAAFFCNEWSKADSVLGPEKVPLQNVTGPPLGIGIYGLYLEETDCDVFCGAEYVKTLGVDSVVVTVVGNGFDDRVSRAFYASEYLPQYLQPGDDFLEDAVEAAHGKNLKFCASVDMPHDNWLYQKGHGDWICVLSDGRPSDIAVSSSEGCIVPPVRVASSPEYLAMMKGIFDELAAAGVDTIDLNDNFQYPVVLEGGRTLYASYDDFSVDQFTMDTGIIISGKDAAERAQIIESDPELFAAWCNWRTAQTTLLLEIFQGYVDEINERRGTSITFRPHLLAEPEIAYEDYGIDHESIAAFADVVYLMMDGNIPEDKYGDIINKSKNAGAKKIVTSTYLNDVSTGDYDKLESRMIKLKKNGAQGITIYNLEIADERAMLDGMPQLISRVREA